AQIVAGVRVYVAVPLALIVGGTLLQPRKKVPVVVATASRGEPPWHCDSLASVNEADANTSPSRPVMSAPAAAFVDDGQFFARCKAPLLKDDVTQPVLSGSNTVGTSAAPDEFASASIRKPAATTIMLLPHRLSSCLARSFPSARSWNRS